MSGHDGHECGGVGSRADKYAQQRDIGSGATILLGLGHHCGSNTKKVVP